MKVIIWFATAAFIIATSATAATFTSSSFSQVTLRSATFVESGESAFHSLMFDWFNDDSAQNGSAFGNGNIYYYPDFYPFPPFQKVITRAYVTGGSDTENLSHRNGLHEWGIIPRDNNTILPPIDLVFDYILQASATSIEDNNGSSFSESEVTAYVYSARATDYTAAVNTKFSGRPNISESLRVGVTKGKEGSEFLERAGSWTFRMSAGEAVSVLTVFDLYGYSKPPVPAPVPLPASLSLLGIGLISLMFARRKKHGVAVLSR